MTSRLTALALRRTVNEGQMNIESSRNGCIDVLYTTMCPRRANKYLALSEETSQPQMGASLKDKWLSIILSFLTWIVVDYVNGVPVQ